MSELPEEKKEEYAPEEDFETGSTVFSAPEEKHDKVKNPALLKKVLISAVAVVIIAGAAVAAALLIPELVTDGTSSDSVSETAIIDSDTDNYSAVTLTGENGTLELYVTEETEESESSDEEPTVTRVWLEKTLPREYTDESSVSSLVESAIGLKYAKIISESVDAETDYGFDEPTYIVTATPNEGGTVTLTVGSLSPDSSGYYVTSSNDGKVYLVRTDYFSSLAVEKLDLATSPTVTAFAEADGSAEYYTEGVLAKFDTLVFKNKNMDKAFTFTTVGESDSMAYNTYKVISPVTRAANDTQLVGVIELFSNGFSSQGIYCLTKTDSDLSAFGLDDPDLEISIKAGNQERSIKAKLQDDGNYAVAVSDIEVILNVAASSFVSESATKSPVDFKESDLFSTFLFIETLSEIDVITIESGDVKHTFGVVTEYDEENDNTSITGIKINGAEAVEPDEFQSYYQFLLGITSLSYENSDIKGKTPETVITMTKKDGSAATVIEYYAAKDGRYQVVVNGDQMGLISSSNHKNVMKYATNVANGKTYNS